MKPKFAALTAVAMLLPLAAPLAAEPLKIAVIETLSGPQASTGLLIQKAAEYGVSKLNAAGGYAGEPIQVVGYDNQGGPVGAADRVKAAIADGAQIIVQGASSAIAGQVTEDVRKHNLRNKGKEVLYLNVGAEALELTGAKCHFHHFRFNTNAQIRVGSLAPVMKEAGVLDGGVYSINQNYSWGQDMEAAIEGAADKVGYKVVGKTLHDVNKIQDFSPYVAQIKASGATAAITGNWSNDLLLLMKAAADAGLSTKFGTAFLDQPGNIANAGQIAEGHFLASPFNAEAAGEAGDAFMQDYKAFAGHYPVFVEPQTVFGMQMLGVALDAVPSQDGAIDVNAIAKALETATSTTPMGAVAMRAADHQLQLPMVVSVVSPDAKYKVDETSYGFVPVRVLSAEEASTPVQDSCQMKRPS